MKPLLAFLALFVLASTSPAAVAQVDPVNMRSGVDSVLIATQTSAGYSKSNLFTVPAGQRFVLTDFSSDGSEGECNIVDNGSTWRWSINQRPTDGSSSNRVAEHHWVTGLVFEAGHMLGARVDENCAGCYVRLSWSGYLVPVSTTAVQTEDHRQFGFSLSPNPARQVVTLRFELAHSADINLGIYDAQGRHVRTVASGQLAAGIHVKTWDGRTEAGTSAPSGVYFARLESSEANSVRRLIRIH